MLHYDTSGHKHSTSDIHTPADAAEEVWVAGCRCGVCKPISPVRLACVLQVAYVKGGLPIWAREGYPMAQGPEDLSAVPALQPDAADEEDSGTKGGFSFPKLPGGFKLPEFSFNPARR